MTQESYLIELRSSPHQRAGRSTVEIMRHVVYALLPVCAFSFVAFGISALLLIVVTTAACMLTEWFFCRLSGKQSTVSDYSAAITGILLALCLPPGFPLWMAAVGGFVSIAMGKTLFGGLGNNPFNPALVGRAFLQAAFPVAITTWAPPFWPRMFSIDRFVSVFQSTAALPFMRPETAPGFIPRLAIDGFSGATPLAQMKFAHSTTPLMDLLTGMAAGSTGETSTLLVFLCGAYLIIRKMMDWRIPTAVLSSVFLASMFFYALDSTKYPSPLLMVFSGGLMLGAMFMASDTVTSPNTNLGCWLYGALIGVLVVVIRIKGGLPEGTMYGILIGNAFSPILDRITQPRPFGARKKARGET